MRQQALVRGLGPGPPNGGEDHGREIYEEGTVVRLARRLCCVLGVPSAAPYPQRPKSLELVRFWSQGCHLVGRSGGPFKRKAAPGGRKVGMAAVRPTCHPKGVDGSHSNRLPVPSWMGTTSSAVAVSRNRTAPVASSASSAFHSSPDDLDRPLLCHRLSKFISSVLICLISVISVPCIIHMPEVPSGGRSPKDELSSAPALIAIGGAGLPPVDKKVVLGIDLFILLH